MKKVFFILLCCCCLSVQAKEFKMQPIPKETRIFLERINISKTKKVLIYSGEDFSDGGNCPFGIAFINAFKKMKSNPNSIFVFKKFSRSKLENLINQMLEHNEKNPTINQAVSFLKTCQLFCIVNLKKDWIANINGFTGDTPKELVNFFRDK